MNDKLSGFPFAPSFLKRGTKQKKEVNSRSSSCLGQEKSRKKRKSEENGTVGTACLACTPLVPPTPHNFNVDCRIVPVSGSSNNLQKIIRLSSGSLMYISGFGKLTLLKGQATILGYEVTCGSPLEFSCPCWTPAISIEALNSNNSTNRKRKELGRSKLSQLLHSTELTELISSDKSTDCVILIEGIPSSEQEWLIAVENQSLYKSTREMDDGESKCSYSIGSALISTISGLSTAGVEPTIFPPSWRSGIDRLVEDLTSCHNQPAVPLKAVVCGAKGVGKSTLLRATVNRLLSVPGNFAVCVIDCDLGQPEFSLPGFVAIHVVTKPILSPPHLHLTEPDTAYFLGDNTTKHEPELFLRALRKLISRYQSLRQMYSNQAHQQATADLAAEARSGNMFDVLNSEQKLEKLDILFPLVVNTDGFIRYLGAEMLMAVMDVVRPTHVLHISTEKDLRLEAVEKLRNNPKAKCAILTCEPGRTSPSRVSATELRNLRLLSYYLRDNSYLNEYMKTISLNRTNAATEKLSPNAEEVEPEPSTPVYIRSGRLLDPHGIVSLALMQVPCVAVPFNSLSVCLPNSNLPANLFLGAINASLVGLVPHASSSTYGPVTRIRQTGNQSSIKGAKSVNMSDRMVEKESSPDYECEGGGQDMICCGNEFDESESVGTIGTPGDSSDDLTADDSLKTNSPNGRSFVPVSVEFDVCNEKEAARQPPSTSTSVVVAAAGCNNSCDLLEYELDCSVIVPDVACVGLAFVRAIDVPSQTMYLIPPCSGLYSRTMLKSRNRGDGLRSTDENDCSVAAEEEDSNGTYPRVILVRGNLTLPSYMLYQPSSPCFGYFSSEVRGEGSSEMKNKRIVRRKSQSRLEE